ncbi:hypothetical protein EBU99_13990 [bacterium]|nr:hypothetical protein [bacterium]
MEYLGMTFVKHTCERCEALFLRLKGYDVKTCGRCDADSLAEKRERGVDEDVAQHIAACAETNS